MNQKAFIVYDGKIIEKYEFEMKVEEVELTPENGFKRFEPGETSWRLLDVSNGKIVYGQGKPVRVACQNNIYYILG